MTRYRLSRQADNDVSDIAMFSISQWGLKRAEQYVVGLHQMFGRLAEAPLLGQDCGDVRPGLRKIRVESHIVFFRVQTDGVLIVRVLHGRMDFLRHL